MDEKTKALVDTTERLASAAAGLPYEVCAASDNACTCGLIHSIPADMPVCQAYAQDEDAGAHFTHEQRVANARFIAHACTSSVALCAAVREQDAALEKERVAWAQLVSVWGLWTKDPETWRSYLDIALKALAEHGVPAHIIAALTPSDAPTSP